MIIQNAVNLTQMLIEKMSNQSTSNKGSKRVTMTVIYNVIFTVQALPSTFKNTLFFCNDYETPAPHDLT